MQSETINELAAALAKAQGEFKPVLKSVQVEVSGTTKEGKPYKYNYRYAPLEDVINATRPALSQNGLAVVQLTDEGEAGTVLETKLIHASGQWISSFKFIGHFVKPQDFGGMLTYYRRYEMATILGISSEDDDDANSVSGQRATIQDKKPAKKETAVNGSNGGNGSNGANGDQHTNGKHESTTQAAATDKPAVQPAATDKPYRFIDFSWHIR